MENSIWTTHYGRQIAINEMSHQHLSNVIHYYKYVLNWKASPSITIEIENRFGGIILPYKPLVSFVEEIKALMLKGYTDGKLNSDIIVDGKWVGKIDYN